LQGTSSTSPTLIKAVKATKDSQNSINSMEASIHLLNLSGRDVNLFWVNNYDGSLVPMSDAPIRPNEPGAYFAATVFHQFVVQAAYGDYQCHSSTSPNPLPYFRVTDREIGEFIHAHIVHRNMCSVSGADLACTIHAPLDQWSLSLLTLIS
jgi:hypothetical protein